MEALNYDPATNDDLAILDELAKRSDWHIRASVIWALSRVGKHPACERDAIERLLAFAPGDDKKLADKICDAFIYDRIPLGNLSDSQLGRLLQNLVPVPDLGEHGIGMVLNWAVNNRPSALIAFIKQRIGRASERRAAGDWSYDIVPRHQNQINLRGLKDSGELPAFRIAVLKQIEQGQFIRDELISLFWAMTVFDEESFGLLRPWLHSGDESRFELALQILRHAPGRMAFSHRSQVLEILEAAEKLGTVRLERTVGVLAANVQPSFFTVLGNEQPPAFVNLRTSAEAALAESELHPLMKRLFEAIEAAASIDLRPFPDIEEDEF